MELMKMVSVMMLLPQEAHCLGAAPRWGVPRVLHRLVVPFHNILGEGNCPGVGALSPVCYLTCSTHKKHKGLTYKIIAMMV